MSCIGEPFHVGISNGGKNFLWSRRRERGRRGRGAGFPSIILRNDQKLNKKQVSSTESKEQRQNLKRTEIITYIRGGGGRPLAKPHQKSSIFKKLFILIKQTF